MAQILRRHEGVGGRAEEEAGRCGQLAPAEEHAAVAHNLGGAQQLQCVKVKDSPGLRLVARAHIVAGEAEYIVDAERGRAQQVALNGDAVAITATHLQDRLIARLRHKRATGDAAHVAVGAGTVGGVDAVADIPQCQRVCIDILRVGGVRRVKFGGHGKMAGAQHLLETGAGFKRFLVVIWRSLVWTLHKQGGRGGKSLWLRRDRAYAESVSSNSIVDQPDGGCASTPSSRFSQALLLCKERFTGGCKSWISPP